MLNRILLSFVAIGMGRVRLDTFVVLQFLSCLHVLRDRVTVLLPEGATRAHVSCAGLKHLFKFLRLN